MYVYIVFHTNISESYLYVLFIFKSSILDFILLSKAVCAPGMDYNNSTPSEFLFKAPIGRHAVSVDCGAKMDGWMGRMMMVSDFLRNQSILLKLVFVNKYYLLVNFACNNSRNFESK